MTDRTAEPQFWVPVCTLKEKQHIGSSKQLPKGSHIVVERFCGLYAHHAILMEDATPAKIVGDGTTKAKVYHYANSGCGPEQSTISWSSCHGQLYKAIYPNKLNNDEERYHKSKHLYKRNRSLYTPMVYNCEYLARSITLLNIDDVNNDDVNNCGRCFFDAFSVQVRRILWMLSIGALWILLRVSVYFAIEKIFGSLDVNNFVHMYIFPAIAIVVFDVLFMFIYYTTCCFYCMRDCKTEIPCCMCKRMKKYSFYCCRCWCCKGDIDLFRTKQDEYTIHHKHSIDGWCALFDAIFRDILFIVGFQLSLISFKLNVCFPDNILSFCILGSFLLAMIGGCVGYIIGGVIVFWINKCCYTRGCVEEVDESRPRSDDHETIHI